ncbi:peptide/nickel transport system permease protein [Arthrobacter sp. SLBN-83]|uniref:ABC transporter permease n=1 Tax=Arthrobacter sp. SLBN-83 TaxID=2768449 RepID=UPI0011542ABB|nr:ABC transporter permease [Arthrobacter sp. SLBN-83]TQJ58024.1 peptide/nickel transport system permease protein [Arthrobacter sp. SLBN-83]
MAVTDIRPAAPGATSLGSGRGRIWKSLRRNPLGLAGGILLALVVLVALLAPLLAPYDPAQVHFATPFQKPGTVGFLLGTDDLGRDIFSRLVFGIRSSLEVGVLAVLLSVVIGTPLGLLAGYWRWLDAIISRLNDVTLAFPFLIIAVGLVAISGPSLGNAAVAIGIAHIPAMIRIIRGETLRIKESDFVMGAKTMDASGGRIIFQHILPNTASALIVQATVIMPAAVIGEAVLSFLGLGIQPPAPSLGIMLSDAQQYLFRSPTAAIVPGLGIAAICLAFNLFGDALRDALDPAATTRKK